MQIKDINLFNLLDRELLIFSKEKHNLSGIKSEAKRHIFIMQLIDSIRRIKYVLTISNRDVSKDRANPKSDYFDPLMAAIWFKRKQMLDEAFWLIFLFVHFGKHFRTNWQLIRDIYGCFDGANIWTWKRISYRPEMFRKWLKDNYLKMMKDGKTHSFGNHRKFETLDPDSYISTATVFESYVKWVNPPRTHSLLIQEIIDNVGDNPRLVFKHLYSSMNQVFRFGRLAKFDYLTMVGKLGLASIEPGSTFLQGATGPLKGARLLFCNNIEANLNYHVLEERLALLETNLSIGQFGMQVLEDAICNWQKSPTIYQYFSG